MDLRRTIRKVRRRRFLPLTRTRPYSTEYGFDRGEPVDRLFIHDLLARHAGDIRGRTLEVKDDRLARRFGADRTSRREVLDIDPGNAEATVVGDLVDPGTLEPRSYDCFVLTQTLQYVTDPPAAVANSYSALAPGGVLLITVPTISMVDVEAAGNDRWRFTPDGLRTLVEDGCEGATATYESYGNPLAVTAFVYGLAVEDLNRESLLRRDPAYPLLACARIAKPAGS